MMKLSLSAPTPRTLHRFNLARIIVASCALPGCVAATSFEQATSTAEVQLEAHRRTALKLEKAEARLAALQEHNEALKSQQGTLEDELMRTEGEVSQAEVGVVTAAKQRDEQSQLVSQLRGDLARAGSHIKDYEAERIERGQQAEELSAENARLQAKLTSITEANHLLEERLSVCSGSEATQDESLFEPGELDQPEPGVVDEQPTELASEEAPPSAAPLQKSAPSDQAPSGQAEHDVKD